MANPLAIDCHTHCFAGPDDPHFPYPADAPYRPAKPATPEALLACMDCAEVDRAIVVHPEPYRDDHRYLEHCLAVGRDRLKGTCLFFAERSGSIAAMTALVERHRGRIVALRIHAYAPGRLPPFGQPALRDFWARAGELGLAVQLHFEPRHAPGFEPLIRAFPSTAVIVDHLGRPFQGSPAEYDVVLGWSALPNVVMKISAIPRREEYPHRDVTPILRTLIDRFGPDRLISGGNFGAGTTPASYRADRDRLRTFLAHLPPEFQAKILGGTAARLFGFA
jgi:predicted TIM-barrel fold metal-dependent hydrolase